MKEKKVKKPGKQDTELDLKKLGARIKALRLKNGYNNHEIFAYENGIDRVQLEDMNGERQTCNIPAFLKLYVLSI